MADHADTDLVWLAAAPIRAQYVAHSGGALAPGSVVASAEQVARAALNLARSRAPGDTVRASYGRAEHALFVHSTENQRRTIRALCASVGAEPVPRSVKLAGWRELARAVREATMLAGSLEQRLLSARVGIPGGGAMIHRTFIACARHALLARELVARDAPEVVIAATTHDAGARALVREARRAGIPSVYIPHAPFAAESRLRDLPFDFAALRGPAELEWYTARGVPGEQLAAVGNPALSPAPPTMPTPLIGDEPVVVALSAFDDWMIRRLVEGVADASCRPVVVAPHPSQSHDALRPHLPSGVVLAKERTYDVLRQGAAALVQTSSGVSLEALLLGIPVIEVRLTDDPLAYPYLVSDLVAKIASPSQLSEALASAETQVGDPQVREALMAYGRTWCSAAGDEAGVAAWDVIRRARAAGQCESLIYDAWSQVVDGASHA